MEEDIAEERLQFWISRSGQTPTSHDAVDGKSTYFIFPKDTAYVCEFLVNDLRNSFGIGLIFQLRGLYVAQQCTVITIFLLWA